MKNKWLKAGNKGFSLVELIVVIAIMAILVGVAVPVYTGYIEKSQKAADVQLVDEIKHAMEIANAAQTLTESAYVKIGADGVVEVGGDGKAQLETVLESTFGSDWENDLAVKYSGWKGVSSTISYKDSSYFGKENELINTVDKLTSALGEVVSKDQTMGDILIGGEFETFLGNNKVNVNDGKAVGNAAVLYVASKTQGKETEITKAFNEGLSAGGASASAIVNNLYASVSQTGIGDAATMAVIYAYAEGYAQFSQQSDSFHTNTDFSDVIDAATALAALDKSFKDLEPAKFEEYMKDQGAKDLKGYIDMMGTVYDNRDVVSGNLNADNCFTDGMVENMLKGHAAMSEMSVTTQDGQVAVVLAVNEDGSCLLHVAPLNWDK